MYGFPCTKSAPVSPRGDAPFKVMPGSFDDVMERLYRLRPDQIEKLTDAVRIPGSSWQLMYTAHYERPSEWQVAAELCRGMKPALVVLETTDGEVLGGTHTDSLETSFLFMTSTYRDPKIFKKRRDQEIDPFIQPVCFGTTDLLVDLTNSTVSSRMVGYHDTGKMGDSLLLLGPDARATLRQLHIFWGFPVEDIAVVVLAAATSVHCIEAHYITTAEHISRTEVYETTTPAPEERIVYVAETASPPPESVYLVEDMRHGTSVVSSSYMDNMRRPGYVMEVQRRAYDTATPSRQKIGGSIPRRRGMSSTGSRRKKTVNSGVSRGYMSPAGVAWSASGQWEKALCDGRGMKADKTPKKKPKKAASIERALWRDELEEILPREATYVCPITGLTYSDSSGFERRRKEANEAMGSVNCPAELLLYNEKQSMTAEECSEEWLAGVLDWAGGEGFGDDVNELWRRTLDKDVMWEGHVIAPNGNEGNAEAFSNHFVHHHPARREGSTVSAQRGCVAGCVRLSSPTRPSPARSRASSVSPADSSQLFSYNPRDGMKK